MKPGWSVSRTMGRFVVVLVGVLALSASACTRERDLFSSDEVQRVAWYVEDVSHGLPRDPGELDYGDEASNSLSTVARWVQGLQVDGRLRTHPQPLQARLDRWPVIAALCQRGLVAVDDRGFLHFDAENAPKNLSERSLIRRTLDQENAARGETNRLLLTLGDVSAADERGAALITSLAQARRHHAAAEGGRPWQDRSASSSPNEVTTSTLDPESSHRRAP